MQLVYAVEREVEAFRDKWLLDETEDNVDEWTDFINLAKGKQQPPFKTCQAFGEELKRIREDDGFLSSRVLVIQELQRVVDRDKAFRELFESAHRRLDIALNEYMVKYCLSFISELEELDVECVRDYENNINIWQGEIRNALIGAEGAMDNINETGKHSFAEYISNYGQILHFMHVALDCLASVTDPFRSWVTADEGYLKKVSLGISALRAEKRELGYHFRRDCSRLAERKSKEIRADFDNKLLHNRVKDKLKNRRYCRKREFSFVDKIERTENILMERKFELQEAQQKVKTRPLHTLVREPSDGMTETCQRLKDDVNRMESYLNQVRRGRRDMRETRYHVQKEYHNLKGEYEESLKHNEKRNQFLSHQTKTIQDLSEELRIIDRKIKALQHIIAVKSHPATVKKIFFQGYTPGERIDFRDTLREAIDVAATGVGRDWDKMYLTLPFNPPRTPGTRSHDLEAIDMDFRTVHPPAEQMALRSLDKWKRLSKVTSVNALVRTLKSIKKPEVAKRIEKNVLTVVN